MYNYVPHSGKERSVRDSEDSAGLGFISKCEYQDEEYEEYEEEVEDVVEDAAAPLRVPGSLLIPQPPSRDHLDTICPFHLLFGSPASAIELLAKMQRARLALSGEWISKTNITQLQR
eukprot:7192562-Pyramimonas_sp.AAC.2